MKLRSIELLRGFAALWVVLYHIDSVYNPLATNFGGPVAQFLEVGHSGVDLFFVISGFVIAWTVFLRPDASRSPFQFVVRRLFRVVPLYWMAIIAWAFFHPDGVTLEALVRSFAFVPDGAAPAPFYGFPVLYVGWSLNYEMMFYAVALAALLLRQGIYALVAALLVMVLAGPYFESIMTSRLIWEFIFGIGAAWIFTRTARINAPTWAYSALAGAAVLVFFVAQMSTSVHFSLIHRGLSSAFLVYALVEAERRGALQFGKFSEWAGSQSYALYLTHPFIVVYAQYHWFLPPKQPHLTALAYVVLPAVSLALTALIHRRVELPIVQFGIRLSHATTANKAARLRRTDGELRESRQVGGTR